MKLSILSLFALCGIATSRPDSGAYSSAIYHGESEAARYFDFYLAECPRTEMRCVYYSGENYNEANILRINLESGIVFETKVAYPKNNYLGLDYQSFGGQAGSSVRKISPDGIKSLHDIVFKFPGPSLPEQGPGRLGFSLSTWGMASIFYFDKRELPPVVREIYGICGAKIEGGQFIKEYPKPNKPEQQEYRGELQAARYFDLFLSECPAAEIRCVYYPSGNYNEANVMTININDGAVTETMLAYGWTSRKFPSSPRKINSDSIKSLVDIISHASRPVPSIQNPGTLGISFKSGATASVFYYDRANLPSLVREIYQLSGGLLKEVAKGRVAKD